MWTNRRSEKGAAAVEAALVTPLLLLMIFGIVELTLYVRDVTSVSAATHSGTRIASTAAGAGPAMCGTIACSPKRPVLADMAAKAIQQAALSFPLNQVTAVTVYQANAGGYPLPTGNTSSTCTTSCVTYTYNGTNFAYASGTWNPALINACTNDANRMSMGVFITAQHKWLMGLFQNPVTISSHTVMQFEPLPNDSCLPSAHP